MWQTKMMQSPLGLYVHIPFCARKCGYCDFPSIAGGSDLYKSYTEAINTEIKSSAMAGRVADTVFFGGGTPSLLPVEMLASILSCLHQTFLITENAEISIEINPGTLTGSKAEACINAGFNRASVGVQSFDDVLLRNCGRIHTGRQARTALAVLQNAGFTNINIDLMSGLPGGTMKKLLKDLHCALSHDVKHISLYTLKIEDGTPFAAAEAAGKLRLPDEAAEEEMYDASIDILAAAGLERYEISNFAVPGKFCRHNMKYWNYKPYSGFGAAAASFAGARRYTNVADVRDYIGNIGICGSALAETSETSPDEAMSEYAFLGLRLLKGVNCRKFFDLFSVNFEEHFEKALIVLQSKGWLVKAGDSYRLTARGLKFGNRAFAEFV